MYAEGQVLYRIGYRGGWHGQPFVVSGKVVTRVSKSGRKYRRLELRSGGTEDSMTGYHPTLADAIGAALLRVARKAWNDGDPRLLFVVVPKLRRLHHKLVRLHLVEGRR